MNIYNMSMIGGAPKKAVKASPKKAAKASPKKSTSKKGLTAPSPAPATAPAPAPVTAPVPVPVAVPVAVPVPAPVPTPVPVVVMSAPSEPQAPTATCNFTLDPADVPLSGQYTTIKCANAAGVLSTKVGHGDKSLYNIYGADNKLNNICVRNNDNSIWCTGKLDTANIQPNTPWTMLRGNDAGNKNISLKKCVLASENKAVNLSTFVCNL